MNFSFITLFPEIISSYFSYGVISRAVRSKLLNIYLYNIRDFSLEPSKTVDDYPYGGGPGMVLKPEPIGLAIEEACSRHPGKVIFLVSTGVPFSSSLAQRLAEEKSLIFVCGRYEGIDSRVIEIFADYQISLGQFILTGGELAALMIADAVSRYIPGVLGNESSTFLESFVNILDLEAPQYTRPKIYNGLPVPETLVSGNHKQIEEFRSKQADSIRAKRICYINKT